MRIVVCHNYFRERGGEDQVFEEEVRLLRVRGHEVATFVRHNDDFQSRGETVRVALSSPWNRRAAADLEDLVRKKRADIVHFHNWFPQISPAGFYAARRGGAAVVQTLHNYRWACPKGIFFRDGMVCEECIGRRVPWPAVRHSCYRDSKAGSSVVSVTIGLHNVLNTTHRVIDAFIAPGPFMKGKMVEAGLPRERIHIKPNFLSADPGPGSGEGGYMMYLGRLSLEKKVDTLLAAWARLGRTVPLKVAGVGPLRSDVEAAAHNDPSIEYLGFAPNDALDGLLGDARALLFTSGTYEGMPMTILKAYAKGTPVIANRLGAMQDMVEDGRTGWHVTPNDPEELARVVKIAFNPSLDVNPMRDAARSKYLMNYTPDRVYETAMKVYQAAIRHRHNNRAGSGLEQR